MLKQIAAIACLVASTSAVTLKSDPVCNSAGCTQYLHPKKDDFKKNYFVPNFGVDHDIITNHKSLDIAEKQLQHHWDFPTGEYKNKKVVEYKTGEPLDEDIVVTGKNLKSTEKLLGHNWKVTEVFKS